MTGMTILLDCGASCGDCEAISSSRHTEVAAAGSRQGYEGIDLSAVTPPPVRSARAKVSSLQPLCRLAPLAVLLATGLAGCGQPTSLGVRVAKTSSSKLLTEHGVLSQQVFGDTALVSVIHPARVSSKN